MSRDNTENIADSRNIELLNEYLNKAIDRFSWNNLPYGLTSEQLENLLIRKGQLFLFKDSTKGFLLLPCSGTANINLYGLPEKYNVYGYNGTLVTDIETENGVLLRNNPMGTQDYSTIEFLVNRIDNIEMTQDVNLFQQCIPKVIIADEESKLTAKSIVQRLKEFKLVIFAKKSLTSNISSSDVLDTTAPYLLDKLQEFKSDYKNELLTFLCINNNKNDSKKERQIVDEVNANNEEIESNYELMFKQRENFCKMVNEKYPDYVTEFGEITVTRKEVMQSGGGDDDTSKDN